MTDNYQFSNTLTWTKGKHTLKFGADVRYNKVDNQSAFDSKGTFTFNNLQDYMNNTAFQLNQALQTASWKANQWQTYLFAQDDFRVTPDLTLNLGLRYELSQVPLGMFGATDAESLVALVPGPAEKETNNWAPRVGFNWSPRSSNPILGDGKTVFRGGFGMGYDVVFYKEPEVLIQEPGQPHALASALQADEVHALVPVARAHQRQAVEAEAQALEDRPHAMLVKGSGFQRAQRQVVVGVLPGVDGAAVEERHLFRQHRSVAGGQHVAAGGQRQPEVVVRTARSYPSPGGRMPPVLHFALQELARRAQQQVLAHELRIGVHQGHHVLQLVPESEGAARLVVAAAADRVVSVSIPDPAALQGRTPVLVDDIISTGRTMAAAVRHLVAQGLNHQSVSRCMRCFPGMLMLNCWQQVPRKS